MKNDNYIGLIILWIIILGIIGLSIWGIVAVLKSDLPTWLKWMILKG